MKGPKVPPCTIRALFCVIVSLFILTDLVSGQEVQEPAPLPSSPSVPAAKPEAIPQYTLRMSRAGSGQGKVSSNLAGDVFKKGTWVALRAVPDDNSVFAGWNGACSGTSTTCNLQMTSDRTVTATFTLKTYTIRVPAPVNGVIHPSGTIKVAHGEKRRFQVIPLPGYRVSDVLVDKASVGATNLYTFDNIRADHVLEAVFVKQ